MSHLLRILFTTIILTIIAGAALYFAADGVKEKGLALLYGSPYVPSDFKKILESVYSSPAIKHQKLINELIVTINKSTSKNETITACQAIALKLSVEAKKVFQDSFQIAKKLVL